MRIFLACTSSIENIGIKSKYVLESYYSGEKNCIKALSSVGKDNFLLDSGAFSYMNGAKCTKEQLLVYLDKYINFINKYDIKYFFELDVDVIFGIEFVEKLRKKLEDGTKKRCIPVWHKSRGVEYWKKLCKEYDYVAIGGFAIKAIKQNEYGIIKKLVDYAYKNNIKVHGLGFTKTKILEKENWHFYSVDSSSWLSSASRGQRLQMFKKNCIVNMEYDKKKVKAKIGKMAEFNYVEWCKYQTYMDDKRF